jgi:hypothetical protein
MADLCIFRSAFVNSLRSNIAMNLDRYRRNEKWVQEIGQRSSRDLDTKIEIKGAFQLDEPDKDNLKDLENAIRVHKLLQQLTPLQARDPRLWTRLTHVDCWQYMRKRWQVERHESDPDKAARYIASRYFVTGTDSRALLRNGVARLWWTAHLTHDAARNNPYELTAVLLSTLDITQQILERNMGRAPAVLTGFLDFLLQNKALLLTGGDQNRVRIRKLAIALNLYGGVCLLDTLSQMEILKILAGELQRALAREKSKDVKVKA